MTEASSTSLDRIARLAGALYLALVPLGVFSFVYVPLRIAGGEPPTGAQLLEAAELVRAGAFGHLASQVLVVFLALAIYRLFRDSQRDRVAVAVALSLLCVPISFVAEVEHLGALDLAASAGSGGLTTGQVDLQVALSLETYRRTILLAQIFWGLWLIALGRIVIRSDLLPALLGIAAAVSGAGYLVDSISYLLSLGLPTISRFTSLAEIALPAWLLIRGVAASDS